MFGLSWHVRSEVVWSVAVWSEAVNMFVWLCCLNWNVRSELVTVLSDAVRFEAVKASPI